MVRLVRDCLEVIEDYKDLYSQMLEDMLKMNNTFVGIVFENRVTRSEDGGMNFSESGTSKKSKEKYKPPH